MSKTSKKMLEIYIGWYFPFIHLAAYYSGDENLIKDCERGDPYEKFAIRAHRVYSSQDIGPSGIIRKALLSYL